MAFFSNWSFIISEKSMVTPRFSFGLKEHFFLFILALPLWYQKKKEKKNQVLLSLHSFKPCKNNPVLVGTTHRKPECLEMRRTFLNDYIVFEALREHYFEK